MGRVTYYSYKHKRTLCPSGAAKKIIKGAARRIFIWCRLES